MTSERAAYLALVELFGANMAVFDPFVTQKLLYIERPHMYSFNVWSFFSNGLMA